MVVLVASSGEEGLRLARAERPDCILLDVEMPGMSGLDAFAALRADAATAAIPVIFVTARTSDRDLREIEALGPLGVLAKPFGVTALPGRVRDLLDAG